MAEQTLADGHADMLGVCRGLIADPEWPIKAQEGRLDDIRKCIADNEGCIGRLFKIRAITCIQNPAVGFERELGIGTITQASSKLKVMIVGGGPAGMEAARVAAMRGHEVVLYEKGSELGGQVNIAAKAPFRHEFGDISRYLGMQMHRLDVKVRLGVEATAETILAESPEAVIVATGSKPRLPDVQGVEQKNVVTYLQVLDEEVEVGQNVVLIDDVGHYQAYGTAEFLLDKGKKVEIVTSNLYGGAAMDLTNLQPLYERLIPKGLKIRAMTGVRRIQGDEVVVYNVYSDEENTIGGVETVVVAVGNDADNSLYYELQGEIKELHAIGDCVAPRNVARAIRDGFMLGRTL
jgi:NADPH-dependent 2,4-dienoyl-CoA reductase/sulfur reductase-like enzyme